MSALDLCADTHYQGEAQAGPDRKVKLLVTTAMTVAMSCIDPLKGLLSLSLLLVLDDVLGEDPVSIVHHILIVARDVALQEGRHQVHACKC